MSSVLGISCTCHTTSGFMNFAFYNSSKQIYDGMHYRRFGVHAYYYDHQNVKYPWPSECKILNLPVIFYKINVQFSWKLIFDKNKQ